MINHNPKIRLLLLLCLLGTFVANRPARASDSEPVIYLHTEFIPYEQRIDRQISYRLMRELVRQGFMIAAQEELGVTVRDGTLHETIPDGAHVIHLAALERASLDNRWHVKLFRVGNPDGRTAARGLWASQPIWEKTYKYRASGSRMYAPVSAMFEKASRHGFVKALQRAGVEKQGRKTSGRPDPTLIQRWDDNLMKVDFAVQFGVLRSIHQSLRQHGESPELLERLCRGYANLSVLTQHHWNTTSEVFAARSWIYGQRLMKIAEDRDRARIHLAYSFAILGAHNHGLRSIELLRDPNSIQPTTDQDEWMRLVQPFLACDRAAVKALGSDHEQLKPWSQFLWFQLTASYRISQWMKSAGEELARDVPTAYGVFATLARYGTSFDSESFGASMGPVALSQNVKSSLQALIDMPQVVDTEPEEPIAPDQSATPEIHEEFAWSPAPQRIASQLRKHSQTSANSNLSWSVLAGLLEDEQFCQIANYLIDKRNNRSQSLGEVMESVLPLVAGHRYAAFIEALYYDAESGWDSIAKLLDPVRLEDPRSNMRLLWQWMRQLRHSQEKPHAAWLYPSRNFTMQGLLESIGNEFRSVHHGEMITQEYCKIVPNSEIGVRLQILHTQEPEPDQLQEWEQELSEDLIAYRLLGHQYAQRESWRDAIRCYEKSMALTPTLGTGMSLADCYRGLQQWDRWEQTLVECLQTDDLGFGHIAAQRELIDGLVEQGRWRDAVPYAVAAAETGHSDSMELASFVFEGLAEWQQSEDWVRQLSQQSPASRGLWYQWCRRTGRGYLVGARELASQYYETKEARNQMELGYFYFLEGEFEEARRIFQALHDENSVDSFPSMLYHLSRLSGDHQRAAELIDSGAREIQARLARGEADQTPDHVPGQVPSATLKAMLNRLVHTGQQWPRELSRSSGVRSGATDKVGLKIIKLTRTGKLSDEEIDEAGQLIDQMYPRGRAASAYWMGQHLAAAGQQEQAIRFWRQSLDAFHVGVEYATLAGHELCRLFGTSRPDDSSRDENEL